MPAAALLLHTTSTNQQGRRTLLHGARLMPPKTSKDVQREKSRAHQPAESAESDQDTVRFHGSVRQRDGPKKRRGACPTIEWRVLCSCQQAVPLRVCMPCTHASCTLLVSSRSVCRCIDHQAFACLCMRGRRRKLVAIQTKACVCSSALGAGLLLGTVRRPTDRAPEPGRQKKADAAHA